MTGQGPELRPIAGDEAIPAVLDALESITSEHLIIDDITTLGAEGFQNDGGQHQFFVVMELGGRYNRTSDRGQQKALLSFDAALSLYGQLTHALHVLMGAGATPEDPGGEG